MNDPALQPYISINRLSVTIHNLGECNSIWLKCEHNPFRFQKRFLHIGATKICTCHASFSCKPKFYTPGNLIKIDTENILSEDYILYTHKNSPAKPIEIPSLKRIVISNLLSTDRLNDLYDSKNVPPSITNDLEPNWEICFTPFCKFFNIYGCSVSCPNQLEPCELENCSYTNYLVSEFYCSEYHTNNIQKQKTHFKKFCSIE
jgi:hypothetical protein